jgi:hypothetical protein
VVQARTFTVGDEVTTTDSGLHLIIRETATRDGRLCYRVEAVDPASPAANGTWWVHPDEVQSIKH